MSPVTEKIGVQSDSFITNPLLEAKKLNDAKWIYGLYGAMDGLSTSFSMLKYFFDMYYTSSSAPTSSSDVLRNWSITPLGVCLMTIEAVVLIGCSVIGNMVDDDGYYLHLMSVEEARKLKHLNCFVWDDSQLVYISPEGVETVFNQSGDVVNLDLIKKVKSKARASTRSLHLSIKQADGLLIKNADSFSRSPPTSTFTGNIASYWPYARDVMKAMKNTYKGVRNTFVLTDLLVVGRGYHYMAVPIGLVLGVLAACNRTWLRKIREERKDAKKLNIDIHGRLLNELLNNNVTISLNDWDLLHSKMMADHEKTKGQIQPPSHSQLFWLYAQLSGALSGLVDAPYLYFGALSLTVALPSSFFFIYVATASFIFAAVCIATRVYEEHTFQRELLASQLDVELVMSIREFQLLRDKLRLIHDELSVIDISIQDKECMDLQQAGLILELEAKWRECQLAQKKLLEQSTYSIGYIFMSGLKNGLDTYGAMASLMFLIATINLVILVPYSPILVLTFVSTGLAGLLFFPALALIRHYFPLQTSDLENAPNPKKERSSLDYFSDIEQEIERKDSPKKNISTPIVYDGVLEILRGACSGAGKGIRGVEQVMAVSQEMGADGHYHDSDSMLIFAWLDAILFALTFGLRGFARLGRGVPAAEKPEKEKIGGTEIDDSIKMETEIASQPVADIAEPEDKTTLTPEPDVPSGFNVENSSNGSPCTVNHNMSNGSIYQLGLFKTSPANSPRPGRLSPDSDTALDLETDHCTF